MLILTRKKSEMIRIGNEIVITVVRTGRSTVKLGIEAPANVRVLRAELGEPRDSRDGRPNEASVGEAANHEEVAEVSSLSGGAATLRQERNFHVAG